MIYVVGVDHKREQFPDSMNVQERIDDFKNLIMKLYRDRNIRLIAEEWSDDARPSSLTGDTYCEALARELGIAHLPCDPSRAERARLHIKARDQIAQELGMSIIAIQENSEEEYRVNEAAKDGDKKREQYWLEKIKSYGITAEDILMVCGYGHADSFVSLARSQGYEALRVPLHSK